MSLKKITIAVLFSLVAMTSAHAGTPQQKAVQAYEQAVKQNLDDVKKWNAIGKALQTVGELDKAIAAFNNVLALGESLKDKEKIAWAYGNLGVVYHTRGEPDKAVEMYQKSLAITEKSGKKESMAGVYVNLGVAYVKKGNTAEAKRYWLKAVELFKTIGSPMAKTVQGWLDNLK